MGGQFSDVIVEAGKRFEVLKIREITGVWQGCCHVENLCRNSVKVYSKKTNISIYNNKISVYCFYCEGVIISTI